MLKPLQTRFSKLFLVATVFAVAVSCSDKDGDPNPKTDIEDVQLSFTEQESIIELPTGLATSENEYAQQVVSALSMVNMMTGNFGLFTIPDGAEKSDDLITVSTGRTAARKGIVWYFNYELEGQQASVAYQIAEDGDKYTFEIFLKLSAASDWALFVYAEEKKDRSAGHFAIHDYTGDSSEMMRWAWTRKGDDVTIKVSEGGFLFLEVKANTKTNAGSLVYYMDGNQKYQEMTWDGNGSGTWIHYNQDGGVLAEGTWEA